MPVSISSTDSGSAAKGGYTPGAGAVCVLIITSLLPPLLITRLDSVETAEQDTAENSAHGRRSMGLPRHGEPPLLGLLPGPEISGYLAHGRSLYCTPSLQVLEHFVDWVHVFLLLENVVCQSPHTPSTGAPGLTYGCTPLFSTKQPLPRKNCLGTTDDQVVSSSTVTENNI